MKKSERLLRAIEKKGYSVVPDTLSWPTGAWKREDVTRWDCYVYGYGQGKRHLVSWYPITELLRRGFRIVSEGGEHGDLEAFPISDKQSTYERRGKQRR